MIAHLPIFPVIVISMLFLQACQPQRTEETTTASTATPQTTAARPESGQVDGTVIDVIEAVGYTYVQVDNNGEILWAAGPRSRFTKGDKIAFNTSMPMKNFHSESLNRDFKLIYFVDTFISDTAIAESHDNVNLPSQAATLTTIRKAEGGQTIADIYAHKDALANNPIKVRGKIVKFTGGILGKNWIHIKDSSTRTDLTVTTDSIAKNGDVVLVEGMLGRNRDFGYGYLYDVIVEDASVTVE